MSTGSFSKVGVVGLGTMGAGIAEVLARGGLDVVGIEVDAGALERGRGHLESSTGRAVKRGRLTEEAQQELLGRVALSTDFAELGSCDLVIEAVPEAMDLKRGVFARLDEVCRADAVLATNTSSLPVTEIAASTRRPAQVVGVHFFNPAPVMRLVEVIRTVLTDPDAVRRVEDLVRALGKTPVTIGDRAGFVANRLLFGYLNQAAGMLESGHATRDDIDTAMTAGAGLPMGPFTLMDLIGLDTCLGVLEAIHAETRDRRHAPSPILSELVRAGLLGRKTGRGFYTYGGDGQDEEKAESSSENQGKPSVGVVGEGFEAVIGKADKACRFLADGAELGDLTACDLIIFAPGATVEDQLAAAEAARTGAILAVTDPAVPILRQAVATGRPEDVVGLRLPEPDAGLVEIATTDACGAGVADRAAALISSLGLTPVRCGGRAGFIVDALRFPYLNDAAAMLGSGYAGADDIDAAMTLGCGYPTGPIADLDRLGAGLAVAVLRGMHAETGDPALVPVPMLQERAAMGRPLR
ncbi:3-hydroxybutyryl-CoA dehydrogenase [Actinomadura sp. NBRC 104412]|uniref:3-hydroxyacyl-CoA dehydrogenase n=1 Tax=Actinomadura sp. NBRC 104412 TaxID=3032203 RepID=UPI0024A2134A|nr:3-hydroxybutyryl-CoA dehydrogenase [Actinomadura sp. NBRC 104412]GLZ04806.1 3-hydroxybutyryl-CoA dehydrogenase [Actinomadura sp. NBRC 104412]